MLQLVIERKVEPADLVLEPNTGLYATPPEGSCRELPAVRFPGNDKVNALDFTAALTFLTDVPLAVNRPFPADELVPESAGDSAALDGLRTRRVYSEVTTRPTMRTFSPVVDAAAVQAVMPRAMGLRLYADAVALTGDVARYRELWRVLESAFRLQDRPLVSALAIYGPAKELGFEERELGRLLILRGRASHAATKGGPEELQRVGREASQRVPRLKCLAERVILTKRTWGTPTTATRELTPATSWVGPNGELVIPQRPVG